jgi:prepilin-type N-terminal cleavage/methylation domain-containing protein
MIQKLRERGSSESGFTLVELLVVMLILGLLAAIAIPSFFNQRDKARDADAKESVRTAQTAMETYATDNQGSYSGGGVAELTAIEATLNDADLQAPDTPASFSPQAGDTADNSYTVTVVSENDSPNHTFSITRHGDGTTELSCVAPADDLDGCPSGGDWG